MRGASEWRKKKDDSLRLTDYRVKQKDNLAKLETKLNTATERLEAAHKARDFAKSEAGKIAEVAKDAQNDCGQDVRIDHGYIGLEVTSLNVEQRKQLMLGGGVTVRKVMPDGPAAAAGIDANDVIVRIDNSPVLSRIDFLFAMLRDDPGSSIDVEFVRDGARRTVTVKLAELPTQSKSDGTEYAGNLVYESGQAQDRVAQATYNVTSVEFDRGSIQRNINQMKGEIDSNEKELGTARALIQAIQHEADLLKLNAKVFKRLVEGSLWTATATDQGSIRMWPIPEASKLGSYSQNQRLSVVPVTPNWCMVPLQNKTIGWTNRIALRIVGSE